MKRINEKLNYKRWKWDWDMKMFGAVELVKLENPEKYQVCPLLIHFPKTEILTSDRCRKAYCYNQQIRRDKFLHGKVTFINYVRVSRKRGAWKNLYVSSLWGGGVKPTLT